MTSTNTIFLCLYSLISSLTLFFFFFNDPATTEIYTLSLHDALPIYRPRPGAQERRQGRAGDAAGSGQRNLWKVRSEEHTSELQSHSDLVCRLLLEKKKKKINQKCTKNKTKIKRTNHAK